MDVSNACVYDGAEAAAEGVAMCQERKRKKAFVPQRSCRMHMANDTYDIVWEMEMEIVEIPEKRRDRSGLS